MNLSDTQRITAILGDMEGEGRQVMARIGPLMYFELRALSERVLGRAGGADSLQPTALVHEAYLKMAGNEDLQLESRHHALCFAARAMRHILVDHARKRSFGGPGGAHPQADLLAVAESEGVGSAELIVLDETLDLLADEHPRKARIIELRFFGGLTQAEIAQVVGVTERSVERDARFAKAWLKRALSTEGDGEGLEGP